MWRVRSGGASLAVQFFSKTGLSDQTGSYPSPFGEGISFKYGRVEQFKEKQPRWAEKGCRWQAHSVLCDTPPACHQGKQLNFLCASEWQLDAWSSSCHCSLRLTPPPEYGKIPLLLQLHTFTAYTHTMWWVIDYSSNQQMSRSCFPGFRSKQTDVKRAIGY